MIVNFKLPLAKVGEHVGVVSIGTDDVTIGIDLPRIDDALYMFVSGQCEKAAESMADGGAFEISDAAAVGELAERCWRLVRDDDPRIDYLEYASFGGNYEDVLRRLPDPERARADLGFQAQVSLDEGLRRTWEWLATHRPSPR